MIRKLLTVALLVAFAVSVRVALVAQDDRNRHADHADAVTAPFPEPLTVPASRDTEADVMVRSMVKNFDDGYQKMDSDEVLDTPDHGMNSDPFNTATTKQKKSKETLARKQRFLKLAHDYAELNNADDLAQMADELEKKIAEESARQKVAEIEAQLKNVIQKFAETKGAKRAQQMLSADAQPTAIAPEAAEIPQIPTEPAAPPASPAPVPDKSAIQSLPEPPALPTNLEPK